MYKWGLLFIVFGTICYMVLEPLPEPLPKSVPEPCPIPSGKPCLDHPKPLAQTLPKLLLQSEWLFPNNSIPISTNYHLVKYVYLSQKCHTVHKSHVLPKSMNKLTLNQPVISGPSQVSKNRVIRMK